MSPVETEFAFQGYRVRVIATEQAEGLWTWSYSINDGELIRASGQTSWNEHHAFEEAAMAARDSIRSALDPQWQITTRHSRL